MHIEKRRSLNLMLLGCICVLFAVVLMVGPVFGQGPDDEFTPLSDHEDIMTAWEGSAHGNTYDPGKGPNTYCSRCHSPQNWDPASRPGVPPNCITCHFSHEEEMRVAETMDFVAEEDWVGISCDTCHVVEGDLINTTSNAWYNPIMAEYEEVATPNELCTQCHVNSIGVSETGGRGVDHEIILGGSAHSNWAATIGEHRPDYCSDCHDPHTQEPLGCVDCHEDMESVETHAGGVDADGVDINALHLASMSCIACHDASGSEVGPHPAEDMGGIWTTIESAMSRSGEPTVSAIVSHSAQWLVECDRCHYADNEWDLSVLTAEGEVPEAGG